MLFSADLSERLEGHYLVPDFEFYFTLKKRFLFLVTCFRLNFDTIYRRLKFVPVKELHFYMPYSYIMTINMVLSTL